MRKASAPLAMEARSVDEIPQGSEWQYEPKWDGFRCILARDAGDVSMFSKSGQDLKRYFPEIVAAALDLNAKSFILDGEIIVPVCPRTRTLLDAAGMSQKCQLLTHALQQTSSTSGISRY